MEVEKHHLAVGSNYLIEVPGLAWFSQEWVETYWILGSLLWGVLNSVLVYITFTVFLSILRNYPVNSMEVIFSGFTSAPSPVN